MMLKDELRSKKPNLSDLSLTAYASTLRNLYKKVFDDQPIKLSKFKETKKIIDFLKDKPANKRKSILAALIAMTDEEEYKDLMKKDINEYNEFISTQKKTEKQEENWVEKEDIDRAYKDLENKAKSLYKKEKPAMKDLQDIQNFIIISLSSGKFIPPRRLLDYTEFKIKNIDKAKDNYYDKGTLVFNRFKGSKEKDQQKIKAPRSLQSIMNKWISLNPTDYLLFDNNGNPLKNTQLNQRLNKIFDGKISVNALRHTFLTDKFGDTIEQQKKIESTMAKMGSSAKMLKNYVKEE